MKVVLKLEKCVGVGQCVKAAPTVFSQDEDDGTAVLLKERPDPAEYVSARAAVRLCPAAAIVIDEG